MQGFLNKKNRIEKAQREQQLVIQMEREYSAPPTEHSRLGSSQKLRQPSGHGARKRITSSNKNLSLAGNQSVTSTHGSRPRLHPIPSAKHQQRREIKTPSAGGQVRNHTAGVSGKQAELDPRNVIKSVKRMRMADYFKRSSAVRSGAPASAGYRRAAAASASSDPLIAKQHFARGQFGGESYYSQPPAPNLGGKGALIDPKRAFEYVCRVEEQRRRDNCDLEDVLGQNERAEAGGEGGKNEELTEEEKWQKVMGKR